MVSAAVPSAHHSRHTGGVPPPANPWLRWARRGWLVIAALAWLTLLASIPFYIRSVGVVTEIEQAAGTIAGSLQFYSPSAQYEWWTDIAFDLLSLGAAGVSLGLAALIFVRRPQEPVAFAGSLLLLLYGVVMAGPLEFLAGQRMAGEFLVQLVAMPLWALVLILFYIFPTGHFVPGWTRWLAWFLIPWAFGVALWPYESILGSTAGFVLFMTIYTLPSLTGPLAQIYRYRRVSTPVEQQQIKWVIIGFTAWLLGGTAVTTLVWVLLKLILIPATRVPTALSSTLMFGARLIWPASVTFVPLSLTIAIFRYRLWDIDVIIRRTLIYSVLTAVLAAAYLASIVALQTGFGLVTGESRNELVTVLSTLAIAALFVPLRARVQRAIDRRFYRKKYDAARTLAAFGAQARDVVELEQLESQLVRVVDETMQPAHVGLWVRPAHRQSKASAGQDL